VKQLRKPLAGKCVLVTGGAGFVGSHLVDHLIKEGVREVVVIDNLFLGREENLAEATASGRLSFYRDDAEFATSLEYIFERHAIDVVFNCATKALNYSFLNPANAFETNTRIILNLLELLRRGRYTTLVHFSTSEVYGSAVYEPMDEAHPRHPTTAYAAGKAAADVALESYVKMFGIDACIVRPFNNYGPRQNWSGMLAGVIPITAWRILSGQQPEVHGDGRQTRDFIHVLDTVRAVLRLYRILPAAESVNVSSDNQIGIEDLVRMICTELGYKGEIARKPSRYSDVLCHNASSAKIRGLIDYELTPFRAGLSETLKWYLQRYSGKE
jgi:UDP-glucose 4-epimerase